MSIDNQRKSKKFKTKKYFEKIEKKITEIHKKSQKFWK